jgi:hypothetical protein
VPSFTSSRGHASVRSDGELELTSCLAGFSANCGDGRPGPADAHFALTRRTRPGRCTRLPGRRSLCQGGLPGNSSCPTPWAAGTPVRSQVPVPRSCQRFGRARASDQDARIRTGGSRTGRCRGLPYLSTDRYMYRQTPATLTEVSALNDRSPSERRQRRATSINGGRNRCTHRNTVTRSTSIPRSSRRVRTVAKDRSSGANGPPA